MSGFASTDRLPHGFICCEIILRVDIKIVFFFFVYEFAYLFGMRLIFSLLVHERKHEYTNNRRFCKMCIYIFF